MVALVNMLSTYADLRIWAASARPRDFVTYHVGNLAADRASNPALNEMAELVRLLQETGWIMQSTKAVKLAAVRGHAYFASRTGAGFAPRCILLGDMTPRQWRAMKAVRDRVGYQSAHRAIRDELAGSEDEAADILAYLYANGWVEPAEQKGFRLSEAGAMAML